MEKISTDVYSYSDKTDVSSGIKISSYTKLPDSIVKDSGKDSDGNIAATGCHFDPNSTIINGYSFNKQICYYNPIGNTASSKYDPNVSSPLSINCIYTYPNNKGFVVFEPFRPAAPLIDICSQVKDLISLKFN